MTTAVSTSEMRTWCLRSGRKALETKLSLCLIKIPARKTNAKAEIQLHGLTWYQLQMSGRFHIPAALSPEKKKVLGIHWIGGLVDPSRPGRWAEMENIPLQRTEPRFLSIPADTVATILTNLWEGRPTVKHQAEPSGSHGSELYMKREGGFSITVFITQPNSMEDWLLP